MLTVREAPPLALSVNVVRPDGLTSRFGLDDPDPRNAPESLTFTTAMPGGFEKCSFSLQRDPRIDYPELELYSDVYVKGIGGRQSAWEGRVDSLPDTGGLQAEAITPQCSGWQDHLQDDNSAAMIYVDRSPSAWVAPSLNRQKVLVADTAPYFQIGASSVDTDPVNNLPELVLDIQDSWVSPYQPIVEAWYDAGAPDQVALVYYDVTFDASLASNVNWNAVLRASPDDADLTDEALTGNLYVSPFGEQSGYVTPSTPYRYILIQYTYGSTPAGAQGAQYRSYWRLAVYGPHGLTGYGPDPVGFLASDVIAHAVANWAPALNFSQGSNGTIQDSAFIIPQLKFTPTTVSQIIQTAAQYELLDWAVWENRTFWLNPRDQYARSRNWMTRVAPAQLQQAGKQASRLYNGVVIQWTNVDGTPGIAGPPATGWAITDPTLADSDPANPANQAGINKWATLQMQGDADPTTAIQTGATFLEAQKTLDQAGQAVVTGTIMDGSGVEWPAWMVRGGDTIQFTDAADSSPRRIVSTSYDTPSRANSIQIDQPPDSMSALLQRLSVALVPYGLS